MSRHTIEHDPNEPKIDRSRGPWLSTLAILGVGWAGSLYFGLINWHSAALGLATGGVLAGWAIEVSGNKMPESWRRSTASPGGSNSKQRVH